MLAKSRTHELSLAALSALAAAGAAWAWRSYDPVADGAPQYFLAAVVVAAGLALLVAGTLMDHRAAPPLPVVVGSVLLTFGALAPHAARAFSPALTGEAEVRAAFSPGAAGRWLVTTSGGGVAIESGQATELRAPLRGSAYVALNGNDAARDEARSRDPLRRLGLSPIARSAFESEEVVRWRAAYRRDAAYLTLIETDGFLAQSVASGLMIQARSSVRAAMSEGTVVGGPAGDTARLREYTLTRRDGGTTLAVDGAEVWRGPQNLPLGLVRIGEPRPDAEHAGTISLHAATYERRLAPDRAPLPGVAPAREELAAHAAPLAIAAALGVAVVIYRRSTRAAL